MSKCYYLLTELVDGQLTSSSHRLNNPEQMVQELTALIHSDRIIHIEAEVGEQAATIMSNGEYHLALWSDAEEGFTIVEPAPPGTFVDIGWNCVPKRNSCPDRERIVAALTLFLNSGELSPLFQWEAI